MKYKLVALDLDGTLLNNEHKISGLNREILAELISRGVLFTLASGRPYQSIKPYGQKLNISLPLITTNGAYLKKVEDKGCLYRSPISLKKVKLLVDYALKENFAIILYYEDSFLTFDKKSIVIQQRLENIPLRLIDDLPTDKEPLKIVLRGKEEKIIAQTDEIKEKFNSFFYITQSAKIYLEFMNPGVSKGVALEKIITYLNIDKEEVVAVGNNYNDLDMFKVAGKSVAMGNSPELVKKSADYLTSTNEENGVAKALYRIFWSEGGYDTGKY